MAGTSRSETVSTRLQRIATLAERCPGMVITTLAHHIDVDWLREAYGRTRKDGATGVDGRTSAEYVANLEGNLRSLLDRAKSGTYRAPPVRRVHIPKGTGSETRPIGIPTFEDKVLQRAIVMALEAVYEQDFHPCSYGFRPGRSAHQALDALWQGLMDMGGGWVVEVDIRRFFDSVDHRHVREILSQRVRDGVVLSLIGKWLNAGVQEAGSVSYPEAGTPQGGVVSPLLANVYLHTVLDQWWEREVRPRLKGRAFLVRYADDFVLVFEQEEDARRVMAVLPKRFGRFGLTLHPEKTRLVPFRRPRDPRGSQRPGTIDLLGFTLHWGLSRKGRWVVKRRTAKDRLSRALKRIAQWCRAVRHHPVAWQHAMLERKLRGHYAYYGVTGNARALGCFWYETRRIWRRWLDRRSQKAKMTWDRYARLLQRYPLPGPVVVHSVYRLAAKP